MTTSLAITALISLALFVGGVAVAIIGYFLRQTMDNLKKTESDTILIRKDLDVLTKDHQNKHESITEKFDDLKDAIIKSTIRIEKLTDTIQELTSKIK